jgi:hypothetical protein
MAMVTVPTIMFRTRQKKTDRLAAELLSRLVYNSIAGRVQSDDRSSFRASKIRLSAFLIRTFHCAFSGID